VKRSLGIFALLFLTATLHFVANSALGDRIVVSASSTETSWEYLNDRVFPINADIKVESNEFSAQFNPFSSLRKNFKNPIIPLSFVEQHSTRRFNLYNFEIKNLLIHFGRKAIFFPFQYFW
jgi:hypothetical protein